MELIAQKMLIAALMIVLEYIIAIVPKVFKVTELLSVNHFHSLVMSEIIVDCMLHAFLTTGNINFVMYFN